MLRSLFFPQSLRAVLAPRAQALCFIAAAGLFAAGGVNAQTLSLDNVPPITLSGSSAISAVSIDPSTGNVTVRSALGTLSSCSSPPPLTANISSFTANPNSVLPGGAFTLSWNSSNTTSCSPSQGTTSWSSLGTLATNGSIGLTAPQSQGTTTYQLTCTNGTTSDTKFVSVTVSTGGGGGNCTPVYTNGSQGTWNGIFVSWPAYNNANRLFVANGQWAALSFVASSSPNQFGTINTTGFPGDGGDSLGQFSIGTVPGCFTQSALGANCLSGTNQYFSISWSNGSGATQCKLTPGQTYWLSYYFPSCAAGTCGRDIANIQQLQSVDK